MAKVTIRYKNGNTVTLEVKPEDESYYDNLPFTNEDVISTEIQS